MLSEKRILLIISGGIAAYKSLDLIRRLRERGAHVTPVMTGSASQFVTPMAVSTLAGEAVHQELFDLTSEAEIGHIQLSRSADLVVVAPATANIMAKMAAGIADDLATTLLLATDTPILVAPAMNVRMWDHPSTQRNLDVLRADGVRFVGPDEGDMACGEFGPGRFAEPLDIVTRIEAHFSSGPLLGKHILITSGPTHEPIDPVRYIANRSSGTQGSALASALIAQGAEVTFVTGPADAKRPVGAKVIEVQSAQDMMHAVEAALPVDAAIFAAAVADWRVASQSQSQSKIKKKNGDLPVLEFVENPDILATVSQMSKGRPELVIGFAAETDDVIANATAKRVRKQCDWIVANDVSPETGIMGGDENLVTVISEHGAETWPRIHKDQVAQKLVEKITSALKERS